MDNQIFNVNGKGNDALLDTLKLAFAQKGPNHKCAGWVVEKKKGLILCWTDGDEVTNFPAELDAIDCLPFVIAWLNSDEAKGIELGRMCEDHDHDGHNSMGFQIYIEDWGHVGDVGWRAICAVRPCYMWHGK